MKRYLYLLIFLFLIVQGCARIPKEAVELSVTVGRDLEEVHRAHQEFALMYFAQIKQDINTFVDEVYKPYIIKTSLEAYDLAGKIEDAQKPNAQLDVLTELDIYVTLVTDNIENFRDSLLSPIEDQEKEVLAAIDDSYQKLQNANSIVTGHLASVRKVTDAQAQLLDRTGIEGLRDKFIDNTVRLSDEINSLVKKGRDVEKDIDKLKEVIESLKSSVENRISENP